MKELQNKKIDVIISISFLVIGLFLPVAEWPSISFLYVLFIFAGVL